ncbi:MAG: peptidase domain-containing ABC transporter [Rhodospirillaceae bacterium]
MANGSSRSWLRQALRPLWPRFANLLAFSLVINLLALAAPVFVLQVYDRVVFHAGLTTLQGLVIGMAAVLAFDFIVRQARARLMQRVALEIDVDLGRRLFDKLAALPLRALETRPQAYWQVVFRDVERVRDMVGGPNAVLLVDVPFVILAIGLIFLIAQPIVWVMLAALALFCTLAWWSSRAVQSASRAERDAGLARDGLVAELIAGRNTVKALALADTLRPRWEDSHAAVIRQSLSRGGRANAFANAGATLAVLTTVSLTAVGALAILDQSLTIGALIAANMLSTRVIGPLNQLVGAWRSLAGYRQSAERLDDLFPEAEERRESAVSRERPKGEIALDRVVFRFAPEAAPVIDGLRLTVKPGALHALVGRNGSGKTTLLKLIQGLYRPAEGRVLLDGADVAQFSRGELARWIGYVPQETFLFAASIRDNIAIGHPDADDAAILAAARAAGADEFIVDFPDGYATAVGEGGGRLSAGQRQRIAIARALLCDPPVLLLDEPTASLDREAEEGLRNVLAGLARERNVLVVTHSPILLSACNNIVVLDRGRIVMAGAAPEIMPRLFSGGPHRPPLERTA